MFSGPFNFPRPKDKVSTTIYLKIWICEINKLLSQAMAANRIWFRWEFADFNKSLKLLLYKTPQKKNAVRTLKLLQVITTKAQIIHYLTLIRITLKYSGQVSSTVTLVVGQVSFPGMICRSTISRALKNSSLAFLNLKTD